VNPDGSQIYSNAKDQIVKSIDARGTTREFEYDANNQINKVKDSNGTYTTENGTNWRNEKGDKLVGTVELKDGAYIRHFANGDQIERLNGERVLHDKNGSNYLEYKDGTRVAIGDKKNADGSVITINDQGRVTKVVDAHNFTREFTWSADGKHIVEFASNSGTWHTTDGRHWNKVVDGKITKESWEG